MRQLILMTFIISLSLASCKKNSSATDLSGKGFIVTQFAICNGTSSTIGNLNVGELYISFDSPTFTPAPNTWYRASNPGVPCGSCGALFRYKTGSDVSPKDAPVSSEADLNVVLTLSNLCN